MTETDALDDDLDVFERFNRAMGQGVVTDPYPSFATLRADHVVPMDLRYHMGRHDDEGDVDVALPVVLTAASFEAVHEVLRDGTRFSSAGYADVMGPVMGRTILQMDEPEHQSYRRLILQAFTRRAMERWEVELVRPIVDRHLDAVLAASEDRAELVRQFTFPFPLDVIAGLFALPEDQHWRFHRLAVAVISVSVDAEGALRASQELADLLLPLIDERRGAPGDDLISLLAHAEHEGQRLTDDEILAFCRLLLPAGAETTYRSSSNLLVGLLTHPDQLDAVRSDRRLIPQAIEEGLRWEPPLLTIMRTAAVDTEVCGVPIPQGAVIVVNLGAANRDDRRWHDPERFDIFRSPQPHVAFASGPHVCLGMHLSRLETQCALEGMFERLPNLRLDPDAEPPAITGHTFRSPAAIHVVFG
ncbi:MAG: cytochrome P450 [Acidimicrobiales bacterium]